MKNNVKQWGHCLATVLLGLMAWVLPQQLWAADGVFDTPGKAFSWYVKGPGIIHFKLIIHDKDAKRSLKHATFYMKDDAGSYNCFYFSEQTCAPTSTVTAEVKNMMESESLLYLTNDQEWTPLCGIGGTATDRPILRETENGNCYAEFDWLYPVRFAGKSLKFGLKNATLWEVGSGKEHTYTAGNKDLGTVELDEIMLDTYDAYPGTEAEDIGSLLLPVVSDHVINWIDAKYKNNKGEWVTVPRLTLPKNSYSGFVRIPAHEIHDELTLTLNVVSASVQSNETPPNNWPTSLSGDITKVVGNVGMIHATHTFNAWVMDQGKDAGSVNLTWKVTDPGYADILDGDAFQIQRSLTGHDEDFQDLAVVLFDAKQEEYSFKDSTLIASLSQERVDAELGIPNVRYRIRRAGTEMWGWDKNLTANWDSPQFRSLHLLKPIEAVSSWENEEERIVRLKWDYKPSDDNIIYTWDDRAEMSVWMLMYNREGELVDGISRSLTTEEVWSKTLALTLNRSCVNYSFVIRTNAGNSPVGNPTGDIYFKIRSDEDWTTFANRVNNGETKLDAILVKSIGWFYDIYPQVGTSEHPYEGQFNGNGQLFRYNYSDNREYAAPFKYVGNGALLQYVRVWGGVKTSRKFAGGLVGRVENNATVHIEHCRGGATIESTVVGNGSHGGLVGL